MLDLVRGEDGLVVVAEIHAQEWVELARERLRVVEILRLVERQANDTNLCEYGQSLELIKCSSD